MYPVTRTLWKVLLRTGTTLSVTLVVSDLAPGLTSISSRRWWRRSSPTESCAEGGWEIVILVISAGCMPSTTSPMSTNSCRYMSRKMVHFTSTLLKPGLSEILKWLNLAWNGWRKQPLRPILFFDHHCILLNRIHDSRALLMMKSMLRDQLK